MVKEENDKLKIDIFDVDERWMKERTSMKAIKEKSELLGSKSYDVDSLDKTGRHALTIEIENSRWGARPMRLELFYQFLTFDSKKQSSCFVLRSVFCLLGYCQEQGKSEDSKWLNDVTFDEDSKQMLDVLNIAKLQADDPPLPLLQFDNKNTSTEVTTKLVLLIDACYSIGMDSYVQASEGVSGWLQGDESSPAIGHLDGYQRQPRYFGRTRWRALQT